MTKLHVAVVNEVTLFFSYKSLIAVKSPDGLLIHENIWGTTTGRHLHKINSDTSKRINKDDFLKQVQEIWGRYKIDVSLETIFINSIPILNLPESEEGKRLIEMGFTEYEIIEALMKVEEEYGTKYTEKFYRILLTKKFCFFENFEWYLEIGVFLRHDNMFDTICLITKKSDGVWIPVKALFENDPEMIIKYNMINHSYDKEPLKSSTFRRLKIVMENNK